MTFLSTDDLGVLRLSLAIAGAATLAVIVPGVLLGAWLARSRGAHVTAIETMLSLPLVLPPTSIGLLLLEVLAPNRPFGALLARAGIEVLFTWRAAVLASAVMALPLLVRSVRTSVEAIDPRLALVARTLGATPSRALLQVTVPLALPGVVAGVLLAFCRALGEFGATILVAGSIVGETRTISLTIFHRVQMGDDAGARRLMLLTVLLAVVAVWASERLMRRSRGDESRERLR